MVTPVLENVLSRSLFEGKKSLSLVSPAECRPVAVPPRSYQRGVLGGPVACSEITVSVSGAGSL